MERRRLPSRHSKLMEHVIQRLESNWLDKAVENQVSYQTERRADRVLSINSGVECAPLILQTRHSSEG